MFSVVCCKVDSPVDLLNEIAYKNISALPIAIASFTVAVACDICSLAI